jgi:hypothetical protein
VPLVLVGLLMIGLCSAAWAAEIVPQLRKFLRNRREAPRTGRRVKTLIQVRNERKNEDELL